VLRPATRWAAARPTTAIFVNSPVCSASDFNTTPIIVTSMVGSDLHIGTVLYEVIVTFIQDMY
jgi:hypothetical protein